jgi:hypothetical protein
MIRFINDKRSRFLNDARELFVLYKRTDLIEKKIIYLLNFLCRQKRY